LRIDRFIRQTSDVERCLLSEELQQMKVPNPISLVRWIRKAMDEIEQRCGSCDHYPQGERARSGRLSETLASALAPAKSAWRVTSCSEPNANRPRISLSFPYVEDRFT